MIDDLPIAAVPGLNHGELRVVDTEPSWIGLAEGERSRILEVCGGPIIASAHIGSTSVPGLPARPIIDLLLGVEEMMHSGETIQPMKLIGYRRHGEQGVPGRRFFSLSHDQRTLVHVHLFRVGSPLWDRAITVHERLSNDAAAVERYRQRRADSLAADPGDALAYEAVKRRFEVDLVDE